MATRRLVMLRGGLAVALAAAVALFLVVNLAGAKFWTQVDLTRARLYTLSTQTREVLRKLDGDVKIVSFLVDGGAVGPDVLQQINSVLEAYHDLNPRRITVETIDPRRDLLRAQALLKDFNIDPLRDSIDIVAVRAGSRTKQVRLTDMVEFEPSEGLGGATPVRSLKVEGALTAAILAVTRARQPQVRFATGHGERDFQAASEAGLSRFVEALGRQDIEASGWDALGSREVPAGADLVVVAGPTASWLPDEREALAKFLRGGGRALLLLEPELQRGGAPAMVSTGLAPLLAGWGIVAEDDIVIDPSRGLPFFGAETFYAPTLGLHPVTSSLGGQPVLFMLARSLKIASPTPAGVVVNSLIETSPESWGETNFGDLQDVRKDDRDIKGPLVVALAAESKPPESQGKAGRLVVVGDADVFGNQALDQLTNRSFALNAVSWLIEEERALGIQPKERTLTKLFLTQQQMTSLFVLLVLALPAIAVGAGFGVWWRRKRR